MEFDVIAAVVVGGTALGGAVGRMTGTLLGVLFIAMIGNGLIHWGIDPDLNKVVRGIIIFLAVVINSNLSLKTCRSKRRLMEILKLNNISKYFGAIVALDKVNLNLNQGEVLGLMGDNGAGKSTLIKIIAGNFKQTEGQITFENEKVEFSKPMDARNKGIEVVYQDLALCDNLTAASNIF